MQTAPPHEPLESNLEFFMIQLLIITFPPSSTSIIPAKPVFGESFHLLISTESFSNVQFSIVTTAPDLLKFQFHDIFQNKLNYMYYHHDLK